MRRFAILISLAVLGCSPPPNAPVVAPSPVVSGGPPPVSGGFTVTSSTFTNGGVIPPGNQPPVLTWSGVPAGTANIVVEVVDTDTGPPFFAHWLVANIDPKATTVVGGVQGQNGSGANGYYPPEPPTGATHHYHFKVLALGHQLQLGDGFTLQDLEKYSQGDILGQTEIVGTFTGK